MRQGPIYVQLAVSCIPEEPTRSRYHSLYHSPWDGVKKNLPHKCTIKDHLKNIIQPHPATKSGGIWEPGSPETAMEPLHSVCSSTAYFENQIYIAYLGFSLKCMYQINHKACLKFMLLISPATVSYHGCGQMGDEPHQIFPNLPAQGGNLRISL